MHYPFRSNVTEQSKAETSIYYNRNEIRSAILNNRPIDDTLHVVAVMSNPLNFKKRLSLTIDFLKRMYLEENVKVYIVELVYNGFNTDFKIPKLYDFEYLKLLVDAPLWHKENMLNVAIQKLLPNDWKAVAWIDADVEFEHPSWPLDTLKVLNGCRDIVQLFSHAIDMDNNKDAMNVFSSFGFMYEKEREYTSRNVLKMFHPGYAWACTRDAYERMKGLLQFAILGSGDQHMATSFAKIGGMSVNSMMDKEYKRQVLDFQFRCRNLRLGYIPVVIRHHYHGSKANRRYVERWKVLVDSGFNPMIHIELNKDNVIIPTKECPKKLLDDIIKYFAERLEDDS